MSIDIPSGYTTILERVPPGDRWRFYNGTDMTIYNSLTEALNAVFMAYKSTLFLVNAREGKVYITEDNKLVEPPIKKYSLYDE